MLKPILAISALLLSGAIIFNISEFIGQENLTDDQIQSVSVYIPSPQSVRETIRATATIEPQQRQDERLNNHSELKEILVKSDQNVHKGDVLAILHSSETSKEKRSSQMELIRLEYKLAKLRQGEKSDDIVKAKRELELAHMDYVKQQKEEVTLKELYDSKAISLKEWQEAVSQLKKLELRYDAEQANLGSARSNQKIELKLAEIEYVKAQQIHQEILKDEENLTIRAKFDGRVIKIRPEASSQDEKKLPFISIATPQQLKASLDIDTFDIPKVKVGTAIEIFLKEHGILVAGRITQIGHEVIDKQSPISGQSRSVIEASAILESNGLERIKLGINAEAQIIIAERKNAITIPLDAILEDDGTYYVYLEQSGQAVRRYIQTGISTNNQVEVLAGITIKERIITRGNLALEHESLVTVSEIIEANTMQAASFGSNVAQNNNMGFSSFSSISPPSEGGFTPATVDENLGM